MSAGIHHMTVTGDSSAVATASAWVRSLGNHTGLLPGDVFRLDLCVSELIANIADHGYTGNGEQEIDLRVESLPDGDGMHVEIADAGKPFDPLAVPPPPAAVSAVETPVGGLGIHLVRTYADACHYERRDGRNVFSFLVRRSMPAAETAEGPVARGRERRLRSVRPAFPLVRANGTVAEQDERGGGDRRLLGFISTCDIFRNVPYGLIEKSVARCPVRAYPAGHVFLRPGDRNHHVGLVVEGRLRVHLGTLDSPDFTEIEAGECAGEMSVIDGKPVSAYVVAAADCRLLLIDRETFVARILPIPEVARNLVSTLADRMRRSNDRMIERLKSSIELQTLQSELSFAHQVQTSMVPERMKLEHSRPEVECAGYMRPAQQVGGDFYDAFYIEPERLAVVIGDVCGKGMPAALFMARTMTLLRSEGMNAAGRTQRQHNLELIERANRHLCRANDAGYFVSVFVAIVDVSTGLLTWVNAGHPAPMLARGSSEFRLMGGPRGVLLGVNHAATYTVGETGLPPGSTMLLYTDGLTEAEDGKGELFGDARALALLNGSKNRDTAAIVDAAVEAVEDFAGGHAQSDDLTLLALRYFGSR
jgi:serine phosphatase RsbU (regulator of sigma subunit)/anti-sigma regulatory factor (Ser/Thr protein kinase)